MNQGTNPTDSTKAPPVLQGSDFLVPDGLTPEISGLAPNQAVDLAAKNQGQVNTFPANPMAELGALAMAVQSGPTAFAGTDDKVSPGETGTAAGDALPIPIWQTNIVQPARLSTDPVGAVTPLGPAGDDSQQSKKAAIDSDPAAVYWSAPPSHGISADGAVFASHATTAAEQVGKAILVQLDNLGSHGRTDFHFHLDPPDLGPVRIHLSATDNTVSARLVVREENARQMLESQLDTLLQRLSGAGISLGRFDVTRDGSGFQGQGQDSSTPAPVGMAASVALPPTASPPGASGPAPAGVIDLVA